MIPLLRPSPSMQMEQNLARAHTTAPHASETRRADRPAYFDLPADVRSVAFSPDGRRFAIATRPANWLSLVRIADIDGKVLRDIEFQGAPVNRPHLWMAFLPLCCARRTKAGCWPLEQPNCQTNSLSTFGVPPAKPALAASNCPQS